MDKREFPVMIGWLIVFLVILTLMLIIYYSNNQNDPSHNTHKDNNNSESSDPHWGVDSANLVDKDLYQCVKDNFGKPNVWGRYLGDIKDVSQGLDLDEVDYLHDKDIKILLIYNHFEDATGYDNGADHATQAIDYANDLDVSDDVALFGDIEPDFPVDSAFIEGWYDTLSDSSYEPGLYGVFNDDSKLLEAYNATKKGTRKNTVIWTAHPQKEITSKKKAPTYKPDGPSDAMVYGWQYGIDSEDCNIDTDLFSEEMIDNIW